MKKRLQLVVALVILFSLTTPQKTTAQTIDVNWSVTYGGSTYDQAMSGVATDDGGFISVGIAESDDLDVTNSSGGEDIWVVKVDEDGALQWQKTYGGSDYDRAFDIIGTDDGGFIIAGSTWSNDGDIPENKGGSDLLALKIDSEGNTEWVKNYGGSGDDSAATLIQTDDGNFAIAGTTSSTDGDVSNSNGGLDIWVIKITPSGELLWEQAYGGSDQDWTKSIRQTTDGGFVIGGTTRSDDGDVSSNIMWDDVWVIKTDENGEIEWKKTYGGTDFEVANDIQQTDDDGYIVAGYTWSDDGDVANLYGEKDVWIIKLDNQGTIEWEKTYGGSAGEGAYAVQIVEDGYVFQANTASADFDINNPMGNDDVWLVKIDTSGEIIWQQTFGGSNKDWAESLIIADNSFIISGYTASNDNDIPENKGDTDFWIINIENPSTTEGDCTWTVTVQDPEYFGDEVSWELRDSDGDVLLSGGNYDVGYYDEQSVVAEGPVEFYISAIGDTNQNKPAYSVANSNGVILWGVTTGGTEETFSGLKCSDPVWVEDYSCDEQHRESAEILGAFEIGGADLHNQLAIDIPVSDQGFTLYGIYLNFFVSAIDNAQFDFILRQDNDGKPGDEIEEISTEVTDYTNLGQAFGRYLYEIELKFEEELELEPNHRYWLELVTDEGAWQSIDYTPIGKGISYNNDYTDGWVVDMTSEFIYALICDDILGVDNFTSSSISFYPNPVGKTLNIQSQNSIQSLRFTNLSGQLVMSLAADEVRSGKVDVTQLSTGLYFVKATLENGRVETFKVVKK